MFARPSTGENLFEFALIVRNFIFLIQDEDELGMYVFGMTLRHRKYFSETDEDRRLLAVLPVPFQRRQDGTVRLEREGGGLPKSADRKFEAERFSKNN